MEQSKSVSKLEELKNRFKFNPETIKPDDKKSNDEEDFRKSYKLENGLNKFRAICFDDQSIIQELEVHMNLGIPFLCPHSVDKTKKCPSCDFGWKLYNENGKKHTDESRNYLKQSKWVIRGIARAKEKEDIEKYGYPVLRFVDFSPTNGKEIQAMCLPEKIEEFGDISDLFSGRDLLITKDEAKAKLRQASVKIERGGKDCPVLSTIGSNSSQFEEVLVKMFDNAPKIEDRFEVKEEEEILELLESHLRKLSKNLSSSTKDDESDFEKEAPGFSAAANSLSSDQEDMEKILKRF